MLKFLWTVVQDLFLTVTIATLIHAVLGRSVGQKGQKIHAVGIWIGVIASVIFTYFKNTTNKIISSHWNHVIYAVIIVLSLLFIIISIIYRKKENAKISFSAVLFSVAGGCLSSIWIFFKLPGVLGYPFNFNTMGNGYLSWYYAQRLIGWALALLILVIYARLLYECAFQIKKRSVPLLVLDLSVLINAFYCFCYFFVPWVTRAKWLSWPVKYNPTEHGWARTLTQLASRNAMVFIWIVALLVLLLSVLFFLENTRVTEAYENSAQLRKLRAQNRHHRRQVGAFVLFLAAAVVCMSAVKAYDTRVIELSAPETYTVDNDRILISMESVSDGHLHRFEYQTEKGINVRWIVVKKPGAASFGVGLDACEVCGNAGYFERNGQVICKRCDVVMNINTIGFKGGCNPIPLSYEVEEGYLVFAMTDIVAGEKEFR